MDTIDDASARPFKLLGGTISEPRGSKTQSPPSIRRIKAGKFPKPVYPGKSPAWPEPEIDALPSVADRDSVTP